MALSFILTDMDGLKAISHQCQGDLEHILIFLITVVTGWIFRGIYLLPIREDIEKLGELTKRLGNNLKVIKMIMKRCLEIKSNQ